MSAVHKIVKLEEFPLKIPVSRNAPETSYRQVAGSELRICWPMFRQ